VSELRPCDQPGVTAKHHIATDAATNTWLELTDISENSLSDIPQVERLSLYVAAVLRFDQRSWASFVVFLSM
jgi:hypothetical protein